MPSRQGGGRRCAGAAEPSVTAGRGGRGVWRVCPRPDQPADPFCLLLQGVLRRYGTDESDYSTGAWVEMGRTAQRAERRQARPG